MSKNKKQSGQNAESTGMNRKLSRKLSSFLLVIVFLAGLSLMLYPTVSDVWNSYHSSQAINSYAESVYAISDEEYSEYIEAAYDYNRRMAAKGTQFHLTEEEAAEYNAILDINGTGIMGYINIPKIEVSMPIYHGVDESVLSKAAGHVEWSSLPVGGESTHIVLSGHRGLPSAKLFTSLDKLVEGDLFMLKVMNETYTYQVDQILVVLPDETDDLAIIDGEDHCTLVTCTPYGINTHRLLVRGVRTENLPDTPDIIIISDARQVRPILVAIMIGVPMYIVFLAFSSIFKKKRKKYD